jgi:hypothetical protein
MAEARPDGIPKKVWDEALKKAKDYNKALSETDAIMDSISQRVIGMGIDAWFDRVEKSAQQLAKEQERINEISNMLESSQKRLNGELESGLSNMSARVDLAGQLEASSLDSLEAFSNRLTIATDLSDLETDILRSAGTLEEKYNMINNALGGTVDLTTGINVGLATTLAGYTDIADSVTNLNGELRGNITLLGEAEAELAKVDRKAFSFMKGLEKYAEVFGKQSVDFLFEFDKVISDAQRDSGIFYKENTAGMADLTSKTRAYGMSVAQTTELMGELGDNLNTTNFNTLKTATEDFAAIQKAIGISSTELVGVAGEMMRFGSSSKDVEEYFESINNTSQRLGVNTRNVVRQITQNIGKMRQFGFTEGEDSLERMAARAELLGIELSEIFDVAEKARTLEGALDMAAELQLAGGSFSQINPMDLLAAARKGPEELGKILTTMGSDIGRFNKETGAYEFDPIDADRLKIVADATGLSLDKIQNAIEKTDEMARKTRDFTGLFAGMEEVDKELAKSSLAQMLTVGENGTVEISEDFKKVFKDNNISNDNLSNMKKEQMKSVLKDAAAQTNSLEDRAKMNQGLEEAFSNFVGAIQSNFAFLTPALNAVAGVLTDLSVGFSKLPEWGKNLTSTVLLFGYGVNKLMKIFKGKSLFQSLSSKISGKSSEKGTSKIGSAGAGGGLGERLKSLGGGLKEMAGAKVMSGILNTGLFAPVGIIALAAVPFLTLMGNIPMKQLAPNFESLAAGLTAMSGTFMGSLALGAFGVAAVLATPSLVFLGVISLIGVPAAAGLTALGAGLNALGGAAVPLGFLGVALIAALGLSMIPFAYALSLTVPLVEAFGNVIVGAMGALPPIIGAMADGFVKVFEVMTLENAGAMYLMAGAMGAMALSTMAFANPLSMLGLFAMTGNLALLAAVMVPLASSLTIGAEGMEKFANAIGKLKTAVADINVSKLEDIQETASQLASASRSSAFDKLASTVQGMVGGGGSGSKNNSERKIVVEIQLDGKTLQSKILKDTRQMVGR